jgi:UDP-N-acetylglucosamine:LPS N-acetylglucosamine transferase
MSTAPGCFAVVTGGGTAGHVLPALAVADGLVASGHAPEEVWYVGAQRGLEARLLPPTPYGHTLLDVVGFQRSLSRRNLAFVPKMLRARREATALLRRLQPKVVVSVGGYASMPSVFAAQKLDIPVVVVSYDKRPGRASQLAARKAAACATAFPDSPLPRARLTGAPLRRQIVEVDRARDRDEARAALGLPLDRFVVAVTGGSQGSGALNAAVAGLVASRADDSGLAVRHVVGERFLGSAGVPRPGSDGILYQVIGYEDQMPAVYAAADLLVGRGGASTVCEAAATGIPAILVPWSGAAEDHQTENVRWLSDGGAAVLLPEGELDAARLESEISRVRNDPAALAALAAAAYEKGALHRSGKLVDLVEEVAGR